MPKEDMKNIEKPATAAPKGGTDDFVVHVMPREFYGKTGTKKPEITKKPPAAPPPKPAPAPAAPPKPAASAQTTPKPAAPKKKKRSKMLFIFVAVAVLALIGVGLVAVFVLPGVGDQQGTTVVVEEPEPSPEPEPEPTPEPVEPQPGIDTDSDGLTDDEETLYGTDFRNPDTDADTFLDGNEVFHRFDPLTPAPSTLLDAGMVTQFTFTDAEPAWEVLYPTAWPNTEATVDTPTGARFLTGTDARILIDRQRKNDGQSFAAWYQTTVTPANGDIDLTESATKEGYASFISEDHRTVYVDTPEHVYIFTYDLGGEERIEFFQTFQMMVNSFRILP